MRAKKTKNQKFRGAGPRPPLNGRQIGAGQIDRVGLRLH